MEFFLSDIGFYFSADKWVLGAYKFWIIFIVEQSLFGSWCGLFSNKLVSNNFGGGMACRKDSEKYRRVPYQAGRLEQQKRTDSSNRPTLLTPTGVDAVSNSAS